MIWFFFFFLEKQRYRDDLSQSVQQAPRIPDADLRGIRNVGFPGSDGVMDEKAYGHIPYQPAQSRRASCVGASLWAGLWPSLGLFLHLCTDCCHNVRVTKPFLLCPHPHFIDTETDHGHEAQFPLLLFLCLKVCSNTESENQCQPRTWIPTVTNFK